MAKCKFDDFVERYEPGGREGINSEHAPAYRRQSPYFAAADKYVPLGQVTARVWFIKFEANYYANLSLSENIQNRESEDGTHCIEDGKFLHFGKALLNVLCLRKSHRRTLPKEIVTALSFLEKALRIQHLNNDPALFNHLTFAIATSLLQQSRYTLQKQYDIGKELELIAGMLQGGYSSKSFRFPYDGFNLLSVRFEYKSPIVSPPRLNDLRIAQNQRMDIPPVGTVSDEVVACVGLAYQLAFADEQAGDLVRFIAASIALGFTAASMRSIELALLRRDCVYRNDTGESRLRLSRPKIDEDQDLKIPDILVELAEQCHLRIFKLTKEAHEAFSFYCSHFHDFKDIDRLFIPVHLRKTFAHPFITFECARAALNLHDAAYLDQIPGVLRGISIHKFVDEPGDLSEYSTDYVGQPTLQIGTAVEFCKSAGLVVALPFGIDMRKRITPGALERMMGTRSKTKKAILKKIYQFGTSVRAWFKTEDVLECLLNDFKLSNFPHWPYASKERDLKLCDALMVFYESANSKNVDPKRKQLLWWKPMLFTPDMMARWLRPTGQGPAMLFKALDVSLLDGAYPTFSVEDARKWHQTEGLLAGVPLIFLDQISGRSSGRQSDYYDDRSRQQKLRGLIDALRGVKGLHVAGPAMAIAERRIPIIDRRDFLFRTASPKHMTELGGCRSDWSINPCEQLGDCLRCGGQVWIKGDAIKLTRIATIKAMSEEIISAGKMKLIKNPRRITIANQITHAQEALDRANEIFAFEEDPTAPKGALMTFKKASTSMSVSDRSAYIRAQG